VSLIVAALGALVVVLGLVGLAQPDRFRTLFDVLHSRTRYWLAIGIRLAVGGLLWWLAEELKHPEVVRVLAGLAVLAAIVLLLMGRERLDRMVNWWLALSNGILRVSAAFAAAFGAYLVYVAT
jgi:hypothetical protein